MTGMRPVQQGLGAEGHTSYEKGVEIPEVATGIDRECREPHHARAPTAQPPKSAIVRPVKTHGPPVCRSADGERSTAITTRNSSNTNIPYKIVKVRTATLSARE
jgi:hypothetical protein